MLATNLLLLLSNDTLYEMLNDIEGLIEACMKYNPGNELPPTLRQASDVIKDEIKIRERYEVDIC